MVIGQQFYTLLPRTSSWHQWCHKQ